MGIPLYFYKITNNFRNIINSNRPKICDRLFLDFNGIIHTSFQSLKTTVELNMTKNDFENILMETIIENMITICKYVYPKNLVYICIDGVAPLPKIYQQRKRRYISSWIKSKVKEDGYNWDSNAISPGTPFMQKLSKRLRVFIETTHYPYEIVLSDSSINGEGEHKIFDYIHYDKNHNFVDVIYGLDADLIMLSLICTNSKKYLLREPQHYGKFTNQNITKNAPFLWLDINACRNQIIKFYDEKVDIHSYVLLCSLIGNDFLPQLSYLSIQNDGIDRIMSIYKNIIETFDVSLITINDNDEYTINYDILTLIFDKLRENEYIEMKRLHDNYYKKNMIFKTNKLKYEYYGVSHKNNKTNDIFNYKNWRFYYYTRLFDMNSHNDTIINDACNSYIQGLNWIVDYYFNKKIKNNWYYPYNYSPSVLDVYNYIEVHKNDTLTLNDETKYIINEDIQLLMIIPRASISVLPDNLQDIINNTKSIGYLYPIDFYIETYLKTKLHECHPKLPYLNFNQLHIAYLNTIS